MTTFDIAKLREIARGMEQNQRFLVSKALDSLENLQRENDALQKIIEGQAAACKRMTDHILEMDEKIGTLQSENDRLNKENFWLSNEGKR